MTNSTRRLIAALGLALAAFVVTPVTEAEAPAATVSKTTAPKATVVSETTVPVAPANRAPAVRPAPLATDTAPANAALNALPALSAPGLKPEVLQKALDAAACANGQGQVKKPHILTVIDYSLPSSQKRLWTFDTRTGELLFHEYAAHGKNSGDLYTKSFSNVSMSLESNIGALVTAEPYYGKNGYSLRLDGLEPGYNDLARPRAIVLHGAWYVSEDFLAQHGRMGRSWGCPAVTDEVARPLIDTIKDGSFLYGYYPDQGYLKASKMLSCSSDPVHIARVATPEDNRIAQAAP